MPESGLKRLLLLFLIFIDHNRKLYEVYSFFDPLRAGSFDGICLSDCL